MKTVLLKLTKKPFVRNLAIVVTGTAAAQVITMAFAPLLTRIYGPEVYGIYGVFMAMVGLITPISALTYPIAIVLPKSDSDAKRIMRISIYVASIIATLVALVLIFFGNHIVNILQVEVIAPFLYLIPIVIILAASLQVMEQWLIRTKQFRITAKVAFLNALLLNSAKAGIGWLNPIATVLIFISALGSGMHALLLYLNMGKYKAKEAQSSIDSANLKDLVKKYSDFPLFRAPQVFINAISQSVPVILLSSLFGPAAVGFYTIGRSVLVMPTNLLSKSVGDVFYPRIVEAANNGENLTRLILKATFLLIGLAIIPFGIVALFGPWLFGFVFGVEWEVAGEYARWLAIWMFSKFINRPSVTAIPILKLQGGLLIYEIISTAARLLALILGFYISGNDILAVALFSLAGVVSYLMLILWVIKSSISFNRV